MTLYYRPASIIDNYTFNHIHYAFDWRVPSGMLVVHRAVAAARAQLQRTGT